MTIRWMGLLEQTGMDTYTISKGRKDTNPISLGFCDLFNSRYYLFIS